MQPAHVLSTFWVFSYFCCIESFRPVAGRAGGRGRRDLPGDAQGHSAAPPPRRLGSGLASDSGEAKGDAESQRAPRPAPSSEPRAEAADAG